MPYLRIADIVSVWIIVRRCLTVTTKHPCTRVSFRSASVIRISYEAWRELSSFTHIDPRQFASFLREHVNLVANKPVLQPIRQLSDKASYKSACRAHEQARRLSFCNNFDYETRDILLSRRRKELISLCGGSADNFALFCQNRIFSYAKTKAQIRCAVTAQLISAFVLATSRQ